MHPANANDAWWSGWQAFSAGETINPYTCDEEAYWFWDAGWWYNALEGL
jgi:hypothetical protein